MDASCIGLANWLCFVSDSARILCGSLLPTDELHSMKKVWKMLGSASVLLLAVAPFLPAQTDKIADGTAEANKVIAKLKAPPGFKVDLWAAEPMLGNPVA